MPLGSDNEIAPRAAPAGAAGRAARLAGAVLCWGVPALCWAAAVVLTRRGAADTALTSRELLAAYYMPALGLVALACVPSLVAHRPPRRPTPRWLPRRTLIALTIAVLAGAVALRLWRVTDWPPAGIGFEEFQLGARAELGPHIYENLLTLYGPPGEHAFSAWAISVAFAAVGQGFHALRLPFVVAGILCPFLLFAVCRRVVAWESALFAVALFAVSWWQIAASRAADEIFFPIWIELLLLWALIELEDSGRAWAGFLVALSSGLLMYEYTSYHLALPLVAAYLLAHAARFAVRLRRCPAASRRAALNAAGDKYGASAVTIALVWWILGRLQLLASAGGIVDFAGGAAQHAQDADGLIAMLAQPSALPAFLVRKLRIPLQAALLPGSDDECRYIGIGTHPLFDPVTALALGAAIILVACTWRRRLHALTLAWAALVIGGAALLPENPNLHRYYTGLPVFFVLIALGADVVWQRATTPHARRRLLAVGIALAAVAAVANIARLRQLYDDPAYRDAWRWPRTEIIAYVRRQPRGDRFCIATSPAAEIDAPTPLAAEYRFLTRDWQVEAAPDLDACLPDPAAAHPAVHVIWAWPESPADLGERLRARYGAVEEAPDIALPQQWFAARVFIVPAT